MSKRSVDETNLPSPSSDEASKAEAVAKKKKPPNTAGAERPAPPKAKFAYMTKEDMPDFTASKKNHVTCMQFSIQDPKEYHCEQGIGPVRKPFNHFMIDESSEWPLHYIYTGCVAVVSKEHYGKQVAAIPHGKGELICGDWWAKGDFKNGAVDGAGAIGKISTGEQWSGRCVYGKFYGEVSKYDNDGSFKGTFNCQGSLEGNANEYMGVGAHELHGIGSYSNNRKNGPWKMTEADGKHYTTWFEDGCEVMEKRTAAVYLKPLPPPTELDADGNPKVYTVDEIVQLAKKDDKTLASAPPKSQNPRERTFVNSLSRELQEAGVIVTHEHKAGPGREALDLKFLRDKFGVLCAVKVYGTELSQNSGDLSHYRHWLRKNDPEIGRMAKEDKLIAVNVLVTEPKQENVEAAEEDMNQFVWTPSKGKFLEYIDGIIADKQKPAVAA